MNKNWMIATLAFSGAAAMMAQPHGEMMHRPGAGGPPPGGPDMVRFAGDMKVVKGQPYSADVANESVQVLGDGTRITRKTAGAVYRDTDGRTRREETQGQDQKSINIFDPVAGVSMTLNPSSKSAAKHPIHVPSADQASHRPAHQFQDGASRGPRRANAQNRVNEDLGTQAFDGVSAQGRRTTTLIPAGSVGNDREIKIVDEVWFSPDLQVVVKSQHSDPRTGEVNYKLSNVKRAEPARALFEAPADYQVQEGRTDRHAGPSPHAQ